MAVEMLILGNKRKKVSGKNTTRKCPKWYELIKKEAKVYRFCNIEITG